MLIVHAQEINYTLNNNNDFKNLGKHELFFWELHNTKAITQKGQSYQLSQAAQARFRLRNHPVYLH